MRWIVLDKFWKKYAKAYGQDPETITPDEAAHDFLEVLHHTDPVSLILSRIS